MNHHYHSYENANMKTFMVNGVEKSFIYFKDGSTAEVYPDKSVGPKMAKERSYAVPILSNAIIGDKYNDVKRFLENGVDANTISPVGNPPIHEALFLNISFEINWDIVRLLLEHGAQVCTLSKFSNSTIFHNFPALCRAPQGLLEVMIRQAKLESEKSGTNIFKVESSFNVNALEYTIRSYTDSYFKKEVINYIKTLIRLGAYSKKDLETALKEQKDIRKTDDIYKFLREYIF